MHIITEKRHSTRDLFPTWPLSRPAGVVREVAQTLAFGALDLIAPVQIEGAYHLECVEQPHIFVANHTSHLDTLVLLKALPRSLRRHMAVAAAADYFYSRRLLGGSVSLFLNTFPFARGASARFSLEHSAWLLENGWSLLVYPEGTRSTDGQIGRFRPGVGLLAVELGVPVVPVHIDGLARVLPKSSTVPHPGSVTVCFGQPITFDWNTPYGAAASILQEAVRCLSTQEVSAK